MQFERKKEKGATVSSLRQMLHAEGKSPVTSVDDAHAGALSLLNLGTASLTKPALRAHRHNTSPAGCCWWRYGVGAMG
jgi:hypothetical protein